MPATADFSSKTANAQSEVSYSKSHRGTSARRTARRAYNRASRHAANRACRNLR